MGVYWAHMKKETAQEKIEIVPNIDSSQDLSIDPMWTSEKISERDTQEENIVMDLLGEYERKRSDVLTALGELLATGRMTREQEKYFLSNLITLVSGGAERVLEGDSSIRVEDVQDQCHLLGDLLASRCRPNEGDLQKELHVSEDQIRVLKEMLADLRKDRCARIEELHGILAESSREDEIYNATIECNLLEKEESGCLRTPEEIAREKELLNLAKSLTVDLFEVPMRRVRRESKMVEEPSHFPSTAQQHGISDSLPNRKIIQNCIFKHLQKNEQGVRDRDILSMNAQVEALKDWKNFQKQSHAPAPVPSLEMLGKNSLTEGSA